MPAHEPRPATPAVAPGPPTVAFAGRLTAEVARHPTRVIAACLASVLGPAVVAHASSPRLAPEAQPPGFVIASEAAVPAPAPGDLSAWRAVAQIASDTCPGLPAAVLVAIGQVESSLGRLAFPSSAGAVGPMQFLPVTWATYGVDGNGDGRADVTDTTDALHGAARLLCANGGADADRLPAALWNYNHSDDYVRQVLALARSGAAR